MENERRKALYNLKTAKNNFAKQLKELKDVYAPYGLSNKLFNEWIVKNLYGKSIDKICEDLCVNKKDFTIEQYMNSTHLKMCTEALVKLTDEAENKVDGNSLDRVGNNLERHAESITADIAERYRNVLAKENGRKTSLYKDLLEIVELNIIKELKEEEIIEFNSKELEECYRDEDGNLYAPELPDYDETEMWETNKKNR